MLWVVEDVDLVSPAGDGACDGDEPFGGELLSLAGDVACNDYEPLGSNI